MTISTFGQQRQIVISVAPAASSDVEYYGTIARTILITNMSAIRVLVENVTLRFQSDSAQAALSVRSECGWELEPNEVREVQVEITPTPLYLKGTNTFDVRVRYRSIDDDQVSDTQRELFSSPSYIIIGEPKTHLGRVFISLKQPEDLPLGHLMARMAQRAGLVPFLKDDNRRLSEDIWTDTIEPALRSSDACIVIWTDNTDWRATGVEREINICRQARIPEALFLEQGLTVPQLYLGTTLEFMRFDIDNPGMAFANGIDALRHRLQDHT